MVHAVLNRFSLLQVERPRLVMLGILLTLIPALLLASQLEVRSSFRELLPEGKASVVEMDRLNARLGGMESLILVVEGADASTHQAFVEKLSPRIRKLGPRWVTGVDDGLRHVRRFAENHWWAYLSAEKLRRLRDDLREAKNREVSKRAGWDLDIDDDETKPAWNIDELRECMAPSLSEEWSSSMPDYYLGEGFGAIVVRTPFGTADDRGRELQSRLEGLSTQVAREMGKPELYVRFTGSLVTSSEEHRAVVNDLAHVGAAGVALVLAVVFLYFLRFRALLAMALTIAVGCAWSFALAWVTVGYLNSATGFLASIIAGNGINFGIVYMARYLEGRHDDGLTMEEAIARARSDTWSGTLTAASCAAIAYGSLAVTRFPGFRQFGIIGGLGMLCCWAATYLLLPAILVESERRFPIEPRGGDWRRRTQWFFAGPLFALAARAPRTVAVLAGAVAIAGAAAGARYVVRDPMEYDLTHIRNDASDPGSARVLARRVATVVGSFSRDGRALAVDRLEEVEPLVAELRRRRDAAPEGAKPFGRVVSILDLVPAGQAERLAIASDIVALVRNVRARGLVDDKTWRDIAPKVPDELRPVDIADLPSEVAWPFEEADGSRGRLVYLVPAVGGSLNDARYLARWADSFRTVTLPDGTVVHGSGPPVIFADVLQSTREEAPRAVLVSLLGTIVVMLVAFRLRRSGWLGLASVLAGGAALLGFFAVTGVKLNFLNFMALPITIGVGADYAVNVMRRHDLDPRGPAQRAFVQTGGAVVLCSLTTMLGYGALLSSINGAVRSFGLAAAVGEVAMILAATVMLPSWVLARRQRREGMHVGTASR